MGFELYSFAKSIEILFEFNSIGPFHEIFLKSTRLNEDKLMKFSNSIRFNSFIINTFFQRNLTELGNSKKGFVNSIQFKSTIELSCLALCLWWCCRFNIRSHWGVACRNFYMLLGLCKSSQHIKYGVGKSHTAGINDYEMGFEWCLDDNRWFLTIRDVFCAL
jgi:hypothetical protein